MGDFSRRAQLSCLCVGLPLLLSFVGMRVFAEVSRSREVAAFNKDTPAVDQALWSASRARAYASGLAIDIGAPVAVLRIPSLGLEVPVYPDDGERYLNRGVGIISGTRLPGEGGHVGIAGHRDGFFRVLKNISPGDRIELRTRAGPQVYRVSSIRVVPSTDRHVLAETAEPSVTLVTCYPFYYIGSAPQRFIVHGER